MSKMGVGLVSMAAKMAARPRLDLQLTRPARLRAMKDPPREALAAEPEVEAIERRGASPRSERELSTAESSRWGPMPPPRVVERRVECRSVVGRNGLAHT